MNTAPIKNRSLLGLRVWFQVKEVAKDGDRRENARKAS
jgi:hypothetical protein